VRLCRPSTTLVHVVQDDVDKEVSWIVNTCSFDSKAAEVIGQAVPAIKLPKVYIVNLKRSDILESEQGDGSIKREFFIAGNKTGFVVRRQPQARNFGKGRVQISQVFLELSFLFLCPCFTV
jgi:hypothetical protein